MTRGIRPGTERTREERFWAKVDWSGGPDACWIWTAATSRDGYGWFGFASRDSRQAHRVSWIINRGPVPAGMRVCHHCDNPPCVNPAHLFLGSDLANARDRDSKGRLPDRRGEAHPNARLLESDIRAIRALREEGLTERALANRFGICPSMAHAIVKRQRWGHVV